MAPYRPILGGSYMMTKVRRFFHTLFGHRMQTQTIQAKDYQFLSKSCRCGKTMHLWTW